MSASSETLPASESAEESGDLRQINTLTEIIQRFQRHRVRVILCGIHDELRGALNAAGIPALVGESHICASMQIVAERVTKSSM